MAYSDESKAQWDPCYYCAIMHMPPLKISFGSDISLSSEPRAQHHAFQRCFRVNVLRAAALQIYEVWKYLCTNGPLLSAAGWPGLSGDRHPEPAETAIANLFLQVDIKTRF
jgi:hypothetical protein